MKTTKKKSPIKWRPTDIKAMKHDAARWFHMDFTNEQIKKILDANPDGYADAIWDDFEQVGHPSGDYGMDTAVRDLWASAVAYYFTGRDWPLNMEDEETSAKFFTDLKAALKKHKIKICKQ